MSANFLSAYFTLNRRYARSINLERDSADTSKLAGYVITERTEQALQRIIEALAGANSSRAWMLTGVYGTGKSAFAHFLSSLCSPSKQEIRRTAETILRQSKIERSLVRMFDENMPESGLVRATATAQREPVAQTVLRALRAGVNSFWDGRTTTNKIFSRQIEALQRRQAKAKNIDAGDILRLIREVAEASGTGVIFILDELGKCLEYAAQNRGASDLFLLQQISELPSESGSRVYLLGLLHQAFSEYGYVLGTVERNEWAKIQGRFEEIPFTESARQMVQIIGHIIQRKPNHKLARLINRQSPAWYSKLEELLEIQDLTSKVFTDAYPIHPLAALTLPHLCIRYAQNDRSLFTFSTSAEPHSLRTFLSENRFSDGVVPLLKLDRLYDYFIDAAGTGLASRPNFQRWAEIKGLIDDHRNGDPDRLRVLKTIGILNLASTTGSLKASRQLVALALCDDPSEASEQQRWEHIIDDLIKRGFVTHRRQVDELRIWEGSDFDVESAIAQHLEGQRSPLASLLSQSCPLRPLVVQRHSYKTGALRYFERRYVSGTDALSSLTCEAEESDGVIGYWVDEAPPVLVPAMTADEKPFVLVEVRHLETLRLRALELTALNDIQANAAELQTDGVARREVRHRLTQSRQMLDAAFTQALVTGTSIKVWVEGKIELLDLRKGLNKRLSDLCDGVYIKGPILWNELINRHELTAQGAKARGQVIAAMLEHPDMEDLGLTGAGPEVSVYHSVLKRTGIHRKVDGTYGFHHPLDKKIKDFWEAIEEFCLSAKETPLTLDHLYQKLRKQPYGVKAGLIPLVFAAFITKHADDVSIYRDGAFIPVLGPEHFELLVKQPARFSVKHYEVLGVRAQVFKEVEDILVSGIKMPAGIRNRTLLSVISPLLQFARKLPLYTQKTKRLSAWAQAVRQVLLEAHEPDKLLFELLPSACGLEPISETGAQAPDAPRELRTRLTSVLKELRETYEVTLLGQCRDYVFEAFGVRQDEGRLREDLRSRASYLQGRSIEPILTRFVLAATDDLSDDQQWLQSLIMVIADKPSESWTDSDSEAFELKLSDVARRFKHLEAIIRDNGSLWGSRAEARRVSVVKTDGTELHDIAWIDEHQREALEGKAEDIIKGLNLDHLQQRALLAILTEKILDPGRNAFLEKSDKLTREESDETHPRALRR